MSSQTRVLLSLLLASMYLASGCGTFTRRDIPPYHIQFHFVHSPGDSEPTKPFDRAEPLIAKFYAYKRDRRAFRPEASFATMPFSVIPSAPLPTKSRELNAKWLHPFVFVIKDPDGLVYRWYRRISESERQDEIERWQAEVQGIHFSLDLQKWVPEGFPWQAGIYEVKGATFVSSSYGRPFEFGPAFFYVDRAPEGGGADQKHILEATLESDKTSYEVGEFITLRGYLKNVGGRTLLVQTRYPFLESRLVDTLTGDFFPMERPVVRPSHTGFSAIEPGQKVQLFEERFVAGRSDPHWGIGNRREMFPGPFGGPDREIVFRLKSKGLFPAHRLPDIGVWSGELESKVVKIAIEREHDQ